MTKKMSSVNRPLGYYELDPKFPWTIVSGKCATKLVLYRKLRFSFISAVRSFNYFFVAIIGYPGVFSEHLMLPRVTKPMLNYLCTLNVQTVNFHFFFSRCNVRHVSFFLSPSLSLFLNVMVNLRVSE